VTGKHGTPLQRALAKIRFDDATGCWLWIGYRSRLGYGRVRDADGHLRQAHAVLYEAFVGPVLEGYELDHLCRVRWCVCPWHLEPVTHRENWLRGETPSAVRFRTDRCSRGHDLADPANVYVRPDGYRQCRTCMRTTRRRLKQLAPERGSGV
jgi:hypothetical protein